MYLGDSPSTTFVAAFRERKREEERGGEKERRREGEKERRREGEKEREAIHNVLYYNK